MGSDLSKPKSEKRFSILRNNKNILSASTDTLSNRSFAKSLLNSSSNNDSSIIVTHRYPTKSTKSLPSSPTTYRKFNDINKYNSILTQSSIQKPDRVNPFYYDYDYVPSETTYVSYNQQPLSVDKAVIYDRYSDLHKQSPYEHVLEFRRDTSSLSNPRSRIYAPHTIYQESERQRSTPVRSPQRIINKNPVYYKGNDSIIYSSESKSPYLYYNSQSNIIDAITKNNGYSYDEIYSPSKTIYSTHKTMSPTSINHKLKPNHVTNSLRPMKNQRKDDEEIIYVPMKKSDFLRTGIALSQHESQNRENLAMSNQFNNNNNNNKNQQNEYLVLKEKTIKKDRLTSTAFETVKYDKSTSPMSYGLKQNLTQSPVNGKNDQQTVVSVTQTDSNSDSQPNTVLKPPTPPSVSLEKPPPPRPPSNRNNYFNLDPTFKKRYQITPTDSNNNDEQLIKNGEISQKEKNTKTRIFNDSKDNLSTSLNSKTKNPISELFDLKKIKKSIF